MTSTIDIVIAGGGRVGFQTAERLADLGHDVTIIEQDERVVSAVTDEWLYFGDVNGTVYAIGSG